MWPEGWKAKTYKVGGGDISLTQIRHFNYTFYNSVWHRFKRVKATVVLPFETLLKDNVKEQWVIDLTRDQAPFFVRNHNVMEWARENIKEGFVSFDFSIDFSLEQLMIFGKSEKKP